MVAPQFWAGIRVPCKNCGAENLVPPRSTVAPPRERRSKGGRREPSFVRLPGFQRKAALGWVDRLELVDLGCLQCGGRARYGDETCPSCGSALKYKPKHRRRALYEESQAILEELAELSGSELPTYTVLLKYATLVAIAEVLEQSTARDLVARYAKRISIDVLLEQCGKLAKIQKRDEKKRDSLSELPRAWLIVKGPGPDYETLKERVEQLLVSG